MRPKSTTFTMLASFIVIASAAFAAPTIGVTRDINPAEAAALVFLVNGEARPYIVTPERAVVAEGRLVALGDAPGTIYREGDGLDRGVYWNAGDHPAAFRFAGFDEVHVIDPGGVLFIGVVQPVHGPSPSAGQNYNRCEVTCGDPEHWYACCRYGVNGAPPVCRCYPAAERQNCAAGGPGAVSCALEQSKKREAGAGPNGVEGGGEEPQ